MGFFNWIFHTFETRADGATPQLVKLTDTVDGVSKVALTDSNNVDIENDPLVNSIPAIETFHHLGHEGKVFMHSERHAAVAIGANSDILIRIPAGSADRQVHLRYSYKGKVNGNSVLDIDVELYKEPTTTADGTPVGTIPSTNDAIVKTTGVLMFENPTVSSPGARKTAGMIAGERGSASSKDQSVPEWILAPDGENARDYLFRATNNSTTDTVDINHAIFFYDTNAT